MRSATRLGEYLALVKVITELYYPIHRNVKDVLCALSLCKASALALGYCQESLDLQFLIEDITKAQRDDPNYFQSTDRNDRVEEVLTPPFLHRLDMARDAIQHNLSADAIKQFVWLEQSKVSESMLAMCDHATDPIQIPLIEEAMCCLETGCYHSAIVMSWSVAFDHIRRWIFASKRKRLKDFNAICATRRCNPVVIYEDFCDMRDHDVLEIAHKAKLYDSNKEKFLKASLGKRNQHGHPSLMPISKEQATGYIDGLIVNVFTNKQFYYRKKSRI